MGLIKGVKISLDVYVALEVLVVKGVTFQVIIGVQTIWSINGQFNYAGDVSLLKIVEKIITLSMEPDVSNYRFVKSGTDSEDFTFDTDIVPETSLEEGEDKDKEGQYFLTVRVDDTEPPDEYEAELKHNLDLLREKFAHLSDMDSGRIILSLKESNIIAWTLENLLPVDVSIKHSFELVYTETIQKQSHRMYRKPKDDFVRKQLGKVLEAAVITPPISPWAFPLVIDP